MSAPFWLDYYWWAYIFAPCKDRSSYPWWCVWEADSPLRLFFICIVCRWRNHPVGVRWYNPGGLEPDMCCKNCGDDLG